MSWDVPPPDWNGHVGRILDSFFAEVKRRFPDYDAPLTVFGSAPIQLCLDDSFTSADADIMVTTGAAELRALAGEIGLGGGGIRSGFAVQIFPPGFFRTTPRYLEPGRAHQEMRHGLRIIIPHVRDILIGKLHRSRTQDQDALDGKDLRAFLRVRQLTGGHPSESELLDDLISCEPSFRLPPDGGLNHFRLNVEDVWRAVFSRSVDVRGEIIEPALRQQILPDQPAVIDRDKLLGDLRPTRE